MIISGSLNELDAQLDHFFSNNPMLTEPTMYRQSWDTLILKNDQEPYHLLYGCHFTVLPVYIFGLVNQVKDSGRLFIEHDLDPAGFMEMATVAAMELFRESTFRHKRGILLTLGQEYAEQLEQFQPQERSEILPGITRRFNVYKIMKDVDFIEDLMSKHSV
jgi:hypothetical protein